MNTDFREKGISCTSADFPFALLAHCKPAPSEGSGGGNLSANPNSYINLIAPIGFLFVIRI